MSKNWRHVRYPFLGPLKADRFDFENGLRLFVIENSVAPVFSYQTWFDVGSRDESKGYSGLAHLFEHMMFKGTKKNLQGVFDRAMESAGARDLNAFTSTDYTAYVASLPIEKLELVIAFESDRMTGLALTKEQFESEREVVRNERKQVMDNNPDGQMYEELQKLAFTKHAYGRPVIGFEEDLDRMTTLDCEKFYRANYAPNNAVVCVVGAVKAKKVASLVHKYYGKIRAQPRRIPGSSTSSEPKQTEERVSVMRLPVQVEKVYMGYKIPDAKDPAQVALHVLSYILSSGRSSRLYRGLIDSGICIDQSVGAHASKDPALLYVSFTCQAGRRADEAINVFDAEIKKICEDGITDAELERVRSRLRTEIHLGLSANASMARFIGQHEIVLGDMRNGLEEIDQIQRVTAKEIQKAAHSFLAKNFRSVVVGRPA